MKILGCFKVVPDLDLVAEEDWCANDQFTVDTSYVKPMWNCFDESALEMMLKLSDLSESFDVVYELNALTIGKSRHETFLKTLYALGYRHAVRIEAEEEINFCPEQIAQAVAGYVKKYEPQDIIVMGQQSSDGSNMKTPYLLAEMLGWPCISQVTNMEPVDEHTIKITSEAENGYYVQIIKTPCVLVVGNAADSYLRVPTLKAKMSLGKQPIEHRTMDEVCEIPEESMVEITDMKKVEKKRNTILIEGDSPEEKAEKAFESYLKERLEG